MSMGSAMGLRGRRLLLLAAVIVAIAVTGIWLRAGGAHHAAPSGSGTAIPVTTAAVEREDMPDYLTGIGTVLAAQTVTVRVRVDGQLERIAFAEGQDVKQGELLAQIDPRPYQAQLAQAMGQKAHDEASLAAALKDLERYTVLVSQNSVAQQTLDTQTATVNQLRASLQSDQAQIDNATVQLGYTTIRAPISGRTGARLLDVGNIVHATDTTGLVVINEVDPIAVTFTLPEKTFQSANRAIAASGTKPLQVTALAQEDQSVLGTGQLRLVNNQIDTATGTYQLKAYFPNASHRLWPGQYVNARLLLGIRHDAITVPQTAVQRGPSGLYVYVVNRDNTVTMRPLDVVQTQDGKAVIDHGLSAGERVVVEGQFKIKPGARIVEAGRSADPPPDAAPGSG
jgi:multidrug efflux system membrane fusion protein